LPGPRHQLIIARNVLDPSEVKYFLAYAPPRTRLSTLLLVAFSRWRVERCFEDGKGEVGLSHYEGRRYRGLKRHLILSALSYLFLVEGKEALAKKKSGVDGVPSPSGDQRLHPVLVV
jgi:SRSO17 transposase